MRFSGRATLALPLLYAPFASAQQYVISTYAGGAPPPTPVPGIAASIGSPYGVATDPAGNVYFASDNCVLKLDTSGILTRVAGNSRAGYSGDGGPATSAQLNITSETLGVSSGVAVDSAGNLYIADHSNSRIRKVTPAGVISTVAGNGNNGYSGDGGPAASAELGFPTGVAVDGSGNLYVADVGDDLIRKITPAGVISTVAGNGNNGYSGDGGPATSAQLASPYGVAVDNAGNLYIADTNNNRIRKVTPAGIISTVAGIGGSGGYSGDGGPAIAAQLRMPEGVAVDGAGNLYIADYSNGRIREVSPAGIITTVAGSGGGPGFSGDGGPANAAQLWTPIGVAADGVGNLYIADTYNYRVRKVTLAGIIGTVAGNGSNYSGDGGSATSAQLFYPNGVAVDSTGNLYVADTNNNRIRKVTPAGIVSTVAGNGNPGYSGDGGPATSAQLNSPYGVAVDSADNVYIADSLNRLIRKVTQTGVISTIAGGGSPPTAAQVDLPTGVGVDTAGNLYIADQGNNAILKVTPAGVISTVAGNGNYGYSGDGGPATRAELAAPSGVAADSAGNLYIADTGNFLIRKVTPAGIISTVAGNGGEGYSGDGGPATSAELWAPAGVAVDGAGSLYIADSGDNRIRKVSPAGIIGTAGGNGAYGYSGDGGTASSAQLYYPDGVAVDNAGNVYVADTDNDAIRLLQPQGPAPAAPVFTPGGIGPDFSSVNTIQPGEWVSIYGTNLASTTTSWNGTFTTTLGGASVTIDGKAAWMEYVSPLQINVQAPDDTATGTVSVVVTTAGGTASGTVTLAQFAPSFLLLDNKHVAGIILRSNGAGAYGGGSYDIIGPTGTSLGYQTVAAKAGDIVELYAIGLGPTNPRVPSGEPFTSAAPTTNPVNVLINSASVTPSFSGLSGAGLYQINLTIPAGLGTGDVPLEALVGGAQTQSGVVISLQ